MCVPSRTLTSYFIIACMFLDPLIASQLSDMKALCTWTNELAERLTSGSFGQWNCSQRLLRTLGGRAGSYWHFHNFRSFFFCTCCRTSIRSSKRWPLVWRTGACFALELLTKALLVFLLGIWTAFCDESHQTCNDSNCRFFTNVHACTAKWASSCMFCLSK